MIMDGGRRTIKVILHANGVVSYNDVYFPQTFYLLVLRVKSEESSTLSFGISPIIVCSSLDLYYQKA